MLNANSMNAVSKAKFGQRFVKPLYESYCFSNIPQTIEFLLTGEQTDIPGLLPGDVFGDLPRKYDKVILFFVDSFGWQFFERYAGNYEFLKTIVKHGVVSKLTSQFPSTTAAHTTTINTGLDVGQSGVYEWFYYEPLVDDIIAPLLFSYARDRERDTLKRTTIPPGAFYPQQAVYQALKAKGIVSYVFMHEAYAHSTFSDVVCREAEVVPFKSLTEVLGVIAEVVVKQKAPPYYYYLYYDRIDTACHQYGPDSPQAAQEIDTFCQAMEQHFFRQLRGHANNTLFIMTADHGHIPMDPQATIYLNQALPGLEQYLETNAQGRLLVPAGSPRDYFLYVKDAYVDEVTSSLREALEGKAEVYKTADLISQRFFGAQEPSAAFLERVGNVVVLPYFGETVRWYTQGAPPMRFLGHHGGLTPEEMEIPLLLLAF